ncbi:DNA polymerase III subunit beta family protein [Vibrio mediterranei]|uniref:DNA polymerase III subunit beta family protein n=1 Tax=Vibrio mediterranei TaxID=689 RepID=UPI0040683E26
MKGKFKPALMEKAVQQISATFDGRQGGSVAEMKIEKRPEGFFASLRGVGNEMDIISDEVPIESDSEMTIRCHWPELKQCFTWPKSAKFAVLDFEVTQEKEKSILTVGVGTTQYEVELSDERLPALDTIEPVVSFVVNKAAFHNALSKCGSMCSIDDVRYYLNGVYLDTSHVKSKSLTLVGTDGHRMGIIDVTVEKSQGKHKGIIVPNRAVKQMLGFIASCEDTHVALGFTENHIAIKGPEGYRMRSGVIDGKYPDYRKPASLIGDNPQDVKLSSEDFLLGLEVANKSQGNEKFPIVELRFNKSKVVFSGHIKKGRNGSVRKAKFEAKMQGFNRDTVTTYATISYIQAAVRACGNGEINLKMSTASKPMLLKNGCETYVVMPVKP